MVRRAAKVDRNQTEIVGALRSLGASVQSLAAVGKGVPDLLVGMQGRNLLMEVKNPPGPRGGMSEDGQRLNDEQVLWHANWSGQVCVVRTVDEAVRAALGRGA